jgi:predicted transposase YdaD
VSKSSKASGLEVAHPDRFHVEHQAQPQANFSQRMFRYFARLYEKHGLPVYPVALFSYESPQRLEPASHRVEFPAWVVLEFNYRVIQLNQLHWRDFVRKPNPVAAALMARMQIRPEERKRVKFECLRLLMTLRLDRARMQLIAGFVDNYLRLSREEERWVKEEMLSLDPAERKDVMEITTSWEEAGRQEGLQQGRQEGELSLLLRLLTRRVGALPLEQEERVRRLSLPQLEALGEALLDFKGAEDFTTWLDAHGGK